MSLLSALETRETAPSVRVLPSRWWAPAPAPPPPLDPRLPPGVSKRSVVGFRGKDQQVAVAEYSRLLVLFLVLGQYDAQCARQLRCKSIMSSVI